MEFMYCIISALLTMLFLEIILTGLRKINGNVFIALQKKANKFKNKKLSKQIAVLFNTVLSIVIKDLFNLSYIKFGIIIGILAIITDEIFETGTDKQKNSLINKNLGKEDVILTYCYYCGGDLDGSDKCPNCGRKLGV